MSKEAMKLALEALEKTALIFGDDSLSSKAAVALREALAEQTAPVQQEPVVRIAELEETVRHLNHALREATEAPTFMGEPVIAEPVASINGVDEYGPMLDWYPHWVNFPVGTKLYTSPQPAQQEPVVWVRTNGLNNSGVAHYGPTCPPGWVGAATAYFKAPVAQSEPAQKPMHPEIKKLYEDFFDKCFKETVDLALYTSPPEQRTVLPDAITDDSESPEYRAGWNECREVMMAGAQRKPLTDDEIDLIGFRAVGKVDCPTLSGLVPYGEEIQPVVREIARAIEAAHGITNE